MPWAIVPKDGVEDGKQLSGDGDQGNHFRLTSLQKALVEGLQDCVVSSGDEGSQEGRGADRGATASNHAFAAPFAGLAGIRRKSSQAGNLAATERPQFRQFCKKNAGNSFTDAGERKSSCRERVSVKV